MDARLPVRGMWMDIPECTSALYVCKGSASYTQTQHNCDIVCYVSRRSFFIMTVPYVRVYSGRASQWGVSVVRYEMYAYAGKPTTIHALRHENYRLGIHDTIGNMYLDVI